MLTKTINLIKFIKIMELESKACLTVLMILIVLVLSQTYAQQDPPLVVGTILQPPYLYTEEVSSDGKNETVYKGFIKDIMNVVSRYAGTPYSFVIRPDSNFGTLRMDGTWGGLIGDLLSQDIDIAAAPLTETADRHRVVSFSTWFQRSGPVAVMRRPESTLKYSKVTLSMRLNRLFDPLSESVWMLSIVAWLVTSITLYFISYVNPYDWRRMCRDKEATMREGESFTCLNSFWFTLSAIFWQGYLRCPRSIGARIVVMSWWLYSLLFVSMYIASLTNFLQAGPMQKFISDDKDGITINSLGDLAFQNEIDYGVLDNGATLSFFRNSQKNEYKRMWAHMKLHPKSSFLSSVDAGIEKVRTSGRKGRKPFAFLMESAMANYYINRQPCDIYVVKEFSTSSSYSFAVNFINNTFLAVVDVALLELRESGALQQMEDVWFPENKCTENLALRASNSNVEQIRFYKVDLASFSGALILLIIGLLCGSLVTGFEICIYKYAETGDRERPAVKKPIDDQGIFIKDSGMQSTDHEPMTDV